MQTISGTTRVYNWGTQDIGGTDFWTVGEGANAGWVDMRDYDTFAAYIRLGPTAWNGADQLDSCYLEQATTNVGGGAKALTNAKNLNQTAANTLDETFSLECKGEDLDVDGGYRYVRCYVAEGGDTGQDDVSMCYVLRVTRYGNANESGCTAYV